MAGFMSTVTNIANKGAFWTKQHAPQLMVGFGMASGLAAIGLFIYATVKIQEPVGEANAELEAIADTKTNSTDYTDEEVKKDKRRVYTKLGGEIVKAYAVPTGLTILSGALILGGTGLLNKRYTNAAVGLASATASLKQYRKGVIDRFGEDVDKQIRYGLKETEVKETITDEDGKKKTVKKKVLVAENPEKDNKDDYCRIFDWTNPYWENGTCYNMIFLNAQQSYFNDLLRINGHVFLNDVLKALGFPPTRAGQEVGWNYSEESDTDGYINFRAQEIKIPLRKTTKSGDEIIEYRDAIALDFNVDGSIINKVDWS